MSLATKDENEDIDRTHNAISVMLFIIEKILVKQFEFSQAQLTILKEEIDKELAKIDPGEKGDKNEQDKK